MVYMSAFCFYIGGYVWHEHGHFDNLHWFRQDSVLQWWLYPNRSGSDTCLINNFSVWELHEWNNAFEDAALAVMHYTEQVNFKEH